MKIIANRTMLLGGKTVEKGKVSEVSDDDGELAIRHGWAAKAPAKAAKAEPQLAETGAPA